MKKTTIALLALAMVFLSGGIVMADLNLRSGQECALIELIFDSYSENIVQTNPTMSCSDKCPLDCEEYSFESCPPRCVIGPSCPGCRDIGCHEKGYDDDWFI